MEQLLNFFSAALDVAVQFLILAILGGVFYTIYVAVRTMASNRAARWDLIVYIIVLLLAALALFMYYPQYAIRAVRIGAQSARPEAELLRDELRQWQPEWQPDAVITAEPHIIPATPTIAVERATPAVTPTPWPTLAATAQATATPQPQPTATPCIIQLSSGTTILCPPTPQVTR